MTFLIGGIAMANYRNNPFTFVYDGAITKNEKGKKEDKTASIFSTHIQSANHVVPIKTDSKPRTDSFKGREDDTGMASSIVNSIEAKAVKQRGHKNVTETNAMQAVRFHRGKDGVLRQICGSWFSGTRKLNRVYLVPARHDEFRKYMTHGVRKINSLPHVKVQRWIKSQEEPQPDDVIPRFRMPPRNIRIGSFLFNLQANIFDGSAKDKFPCFI